MRLADLQLPPRLHNGGAGLVARRLEVEALLREVFLRLPDQRVFGTALINRHRGLSDRGRSERAGLNQRLFVGLGDGRLQGDRRQQSALVDLDLKVVDIDAEHAGRNVGVLDQREIDGGCQRRRKEAIDWRARREIDRVIADDAAEVRASGGQIRFGGELLRLARSQLRLGLGDVGASHLPDVEAIAGLLQRLLEHAHVAALDFKRRGIAQVVHVDG